MKTFLKVADIGSFTKAADRLGTTPQLASKYVRALEDQLGVQLLHRSTRHVSMTENGAAFYERCLRLIDDFDELTMAVQKDRHEPRGELRLTAPHCFGSKYLVDALADFSDEFADVAVSLRLTDRYVDLLDEGLDIAVRIGDLDDSTLLSKQISKTPLIICASPAYMANRPALNHPDDLLSHDCIIDTNFRTHSKWQFEVNGQSQALAVKGRFKVNSASGARSLALKDKGIFLTPKYMVADDLVEGRLVALLTDYMQSHLAINAIYPPTRHLSAKVRRFISFASDRFRYLR